MSYCICVFYLVAIFILAKCLMSEGKTDEAVTLLRESMDIEKSVYPDNQACIAISKLFNPRVFQCTRVVPVEQLLRCVLE